MNKFPVLILVVAMALFQWGSVVAEEDPVAASSSNLVELVESSDQELFLRCCWAKGRSGFHFCSEYGVCKNGSGNTCVGVGAAEGREITCGDEPPDLGAEDDS